MGIDMEQICEMRDVNRVNEGDLKIAYFHEKLPFGSKKISCYDSPKILIPKNDGEGMGIVIDQPEDIVSMSIDSIRPLPPLLESIDKSSAIWGAALKNDEIILLVDFYNLLNCETKEVIERVKS